MGFDIVNDLLNQTVLIQQVAIGKDRNFKRDLVTVEVNANKAADSGDLNQRLLHRRITQGIPLLQQINLQHCGVWIRRKGRFA